ncbi:MAG: hypothetical protein Q9191_006063 [Dirinaria sp. TL-2023a]
MTSSPRGRLELPNYSPSTSPQRGAPESPVKRRRFLQLTDENGGEMTIEAFLYQSDEYRSTTASIPFPLPLVPGRYPEALNKRLQNDVDLRSSLYNLLERHQVIVKRMSFEILSKLGYPRGGSKPTPTLQIASEHLDSAGRHQWSSAKRGCQAILEERNIQAEVEIIDLNRAFIPTLLPIHPEDPHIAAYESFRQRLISYVISELGNQWCSLCIYAVEHNHNAGRTYQIVLMVPPFTVYGWALMTRRIYKHFIDPLPSLTRDIGVTIIPGVTSAMLADNEESERDDNANGKSFYSTLTALPSIGASIGVMGAKGGGTLGGYVSLKQSNQIQRCILTTSHVVQPASTISKAHTDSYLKSGVNLPTLSNDNMQDPRRSNVHTMAIKDINATRSAAQKTIARIHRTRAEQQAMERELYNRLKQQEEAKPEREQSDLAHLFQHSLKMEPIPVGSLVRAEEDKIHQEMKGRDTSLLDIRISGLKKATDYANSILAICNSMPRTIGKVYYASGAGLSAAGQTLDFALVAPDPNDKDLLNHAATDNYLPPRPAFEGKEPQDFECLAEDYTYPEQVRGVGSLVKGEWYFKKGRTTGITVGVCHGTETYVRMAAGHRTKYLANGTKDPSFNPYPSYTSELMIVTSKTRELKDPSSRAFSQPGDSGAMVIGVAGTVDGLNVGFVCGLCGPAIHPDIFTTGERGSREGEIDSDKSDPTKVTEYAAPCGVVMSMDVVQDHLRMTAQGASLIVP